MPPFKDEHVLIIAPGSQTTLAQLGLPESYTPARLRVKTRMFPAEKEGEWEPLKVREKTVRTQVAPPSEATDGISEERQYEEDPTSDEGAVYPLRNGKVVNWSCFYALLTHVYNTLSPPFHTPILVIAQPAWTQQDKEHLTQFFFEKFKTPAFALMDSAQSTLYAYSLQTATIIDVGHGKCDVTAITDFMTNDIGRGIAIPNSGGEAMTDRLLELLEPKGFNRDMADQLKKSSICEILPIGSPPPTEDGSNAPANPAAAASTGVTKSGPEASAPTNNIPRGPGPNTAAGEEEDAKAAGEDEGVLDIASILTSGKASEIIAKKEKEKAEKAAKKKGESDAAAAVAARQARLPNSQKIKAVLHYDEKRSEKELEANKRAHGVVDHSVVEPSDSAAAPGTAPAAAGEMVDSVQAQKDERKRVRDTSLYVRKEIEVGNERFQAADNGLLERIADAVHRCILSAPEAKSRSILWDSLIILGNGSKVKGFKEALVSVLNAKYLIPPSSGTMFTSELPSNFSTPVATGTNTPQPQVGPTPHGSSVNPLLAAAVTAQNPALAPPGYMQQQQYGQPLLHPQQQTGHAQTPTSIKVAKMAEYFSEWKDVGFDEAHFLGAQVAAKVIFIMDGGVNKGFMSRVEYNETGPQGIHEYLYS